MSDATETPPATTRPSTLHLMGSTPLRDALRGRLTGRLDIAGACDRAGLPAILKQTILTIVRQTRLWRIERAEVGAELIAHFRDGLDSGRSPDELVGGFGDIAVAARLIRRTKKQCRALPWRLWILSLKATGALLLLCLACYAILFIRYHTGHTTLTENLTQDLNGRVNQIPVEQRAWSRYKEAIRSSVKFPDELTRAKAQWPLVPPDSPLRPAAIAYLEQNRAALDHVHAAAQMPHLGYILSDRISPGEPWYDPAVPPPAWDDPRWKDNPPAICILLPSLGEFRKYAHLLMFDSLIAREEGDGERAARNIRTVIAMAEHTRELPFLISDLVSIALIARACEDLNTTIHEAPDLLSEAQLVSVAHALAAFPKDGGPLIRYEGEARGFDDALQRIYTDDGNGNGRISADGVRFLQSYASTYDKSPLDPVLEPLSVALIADRASTRREYHALLNEAITAARKPIWTWTESPDANIQAREQDFMWRQRFPLIKSLMFAMTRTEISAYRLSQTRDASLTLIALTIAKQRHGAYPSALRELTPELLPALPIDMFDGNPLRYALVNGKPLLYSIGADRKDDGGRLPMNPYSHYTSEWRTEAEVASMLSSSISRATMDGDWVLYPPLPPLPPLPDESLDDERREDATRAVTDAPASTTTAPAEN